MFTIQEEYYCINGCLKYPINNKRIFNLIQYLAPSCNVEEADYYKISPNNFHYGRAMEGQFKEDKLRNFCLQQISHIRLYS